MMTLDEVQAKLDALCVAYKRGEDRIWVKNANRHDETLCLDAHEDGVRVDYADTSQCGGYMSYGVMDWDAALVKLKDFTRLR